MAQTQEFLEAVKKGERERVERMLGEEAGLAAARDAQGASATLLAIYHNEPEIARLLADRITPDIFEASALGDMALVRQVVDRDGSLVNAYAPNGFTPLGLAIFFRHVDIARYLLARGANVNQAARNALGVAPIHSALASGDLALIRTLIERGANVNARQARGFTPLHEAAFSGRRDIAELLLARGADPGATNDDGKTALDVAREKGHVGVASLLEEHR